MVLRGWTDAKKLRWALTSLTDLKLVLENVTDWDQLHDYLSGYAIKALDVRLDRTSLGEKDVADLALALVGAHTDRWELLSVRMHRDGTDGTAQLMDCA